MLLFYALSYKNKIKMSSNSWEEAASLPWIGNVNTTDVWNNITNADDVRKDFYITVAVLVIMFCTFICLMLILRDMVKACLTWLCCCPCRSVYLLFKCCKKQQHKRPKTGFGSDDLDRLERNQVF